MSKIKQVFALIAVFLFFSSVFAQSLELSINTANLDINNPLQLTVSLADVPGGGRIGIDGLQENFDIISQAQSQSIQIINGRRSASTQLQIQAKAKMTGDFVIGPAKIQVGTGIISSNTVKVKVSGEKLFVNGAPSGWQNNPTINTNLSSNTPSNSNTSPTLNNRATNTSNPESISNEEVSQNPNTIPTFIILILAGLLILAVILRQRKKSLSSDIFSPRSTNAVALRYAEQKSPKSPSSSSNIFLPRRIAGQASSPTSSDIFRTNLPKSPPTLKSKNYPEKLEKRIRSFIGSKLNIDTSSLTFEELHTLWAKAHGKTDQEIHDAITNNTCLLYQILKKLEYITYAEKEENLEGLHEMVKQWKNNIKKMKSDEK